jgi:hypothetical protein
VKILQRVQDWLNETPGETRRPYMAQCTTCSTEIPPGTDYVCVERKVEHADQRGVVTVVDAEVIAEWCVACVPPHGSLLSI